MEVDFSNAKPEDFKIVTDVQENIAADPVSEAPADVEKVQEVPEQKAEVAEVKQDVQPPAKTEPAREYSFKDDFIKGVVDYYEKTGDITPYLQAKTVDFSKMSDEEILRRNLREQYADLTDKAFDRLYKQQVVDKFKLNVDEYGEEDSELGRELLKTEASRIRSQYIDWQKNFSAPEPEVDNTIQETIQQFEKDVRESNLTKQILNDKRISIKVGDSEFNYEIPNTDALLNMTIDNDKFFSQFATGEGQLDYAKWYKTAAYSQNPEQFEKALINYGKALGREEVTKEIKNPSTTPANDVPTEGSGDFTSGLLHAFASRGIHK